MSKALTIFDNAPPPSTQDVDQFFGGGNIKERATVPSVTYGGKVWTLNLNGERHKLTKRDEDGDEAPVPILRVVVLGYADSMGRTYYPGEYDPDKPGKPDCWSDDGRTPHASVQEPIAKSCADCPKAVKGSKITPQGKAVTACALHRMVVVAPANNLGQMPPLRLRLAVTSNYDKKSPELEAAGWYAFQQYVDLLRARRVPHSAMLVTKMKFDPNVDYPKVIFSPDRWLEDSEKAIVGPMSQLPEVKQLLSGAWSPNGADGVRTDGPAKPAIAAPVEEDIKPAKVKIPVDEDDDDDMPPAPIAKEPKTKAKAKAKPVIDDEDDDEDVVVPIKKTPKAAPKVAPVAAADEDDIEALLGEWE